MTWKPLTRLRCACGGWACRRWAVKCPSTQGLLWVDSRYPYERALSTYGCASRIRAFLFADQLGIGSS